MEKTSKIYDNLGKILVFLGIALFITIIIFAIFVNEEEGLIKSKIPDNVSDCRNFSFYDAVSCLIEFVEPFYNYTVTKDRDRSFEEIKADGGDCYDYSNLFEDLAISIGLQARTFSMFDEDDTRGHRVVVMWDVNLTGYCIIDTLDAVCNTLG
jgi:hypothetical protein